MNYQKLWFEELKYSQNPFSIKPQAKSQLYGRDEIINQVLEAVRDNQIVVVEGEYGSGKTTLLNKLVSRFGGLRKVVYLSCNRLTDSLDINRLLYNRFGPVTRILRIKSKQMILLLDEAQYLSEYDIKNLRQYHQDGYLRSVVFVTHDKSELNLSSPVSMAVKNTTYTLKSLSHDDVILLVRSRVGDHPLLSDDVVLKIYERDNSIRPFLKNCETFMRHMVAQKRKVAKAADVDKILDEFKF
jgi:predicted AAA+ superfamily ATPase